MFTDQPHVFQLLFSNKSVSRAIKNLAAFVRDVTNSPANEQIERKKDPHYMTDDLLTIRNINPRGKMTDIKQKMLNNFSEQEWNDWENRLSRVSIKERLDDVNHAYEKIMKEQAEIPSN